VARSYEVELAIENSGCQRQVNADREAIHQIFSNLIENALKYAASGKKVILEPRAAANASNFTSGTSGRAFLRQHLPRLFERFYRVDKARSREIGRHWTGTGASQAYRPGAWGNDSRESELHHGSTFLVYSARVGADTA